MRTRVRYRPNRAATKTREAFADFGQRLRDAAEREARDADPFSDSPIPAVAARSPRPLQAAPSCPVCGDPVRPPHGACDPLATCDGCGQRQIVEVTR